MPLVLTNRTIHSTTIMSRVMRLAVGGILLAAAALGGWAWQTRAGGEVAMSTTSAPPGPKPRVAVPQQELDFGTIDVGEVRKHSFVVRNDGDADLSIELASTTCKCTSANIKEPLVGPGRFTEIVLEWEGEESDKHFRQGARFRTNDPACPEFGLGIVGAVRSRMAIHPELLYFSEVPKNAERRIPVILYSQSLRKLKITKVESTYANVTVESKEANAESLASLDARSGRELVLVFKPDANTTGAFHGTVRVSYEAEEETGRATFDKPYEFHFTGETKGDVSLHGRDVVGRVLNLGTVARYRGARSRLYLHFRSEADLKPQLGDVKPDFLKVRLGDPQKLAASVIRYPIDVEVPPGAPSVTMSTAETFGRIEIRSDHPEHRRVGFDVALIVGQ
jgi:hypothetical protein